MTTPQQLQLVQPPALTDVLNQTKRNVSVGINCINIGIIQSFDAATQSATIQLALRRITAIFPDGTRTVEDRPLLKSCPCFILSGGESYLTMPIAAGDECLVLFNDREIDQWYANGGTQTPITLRIHSSADAFAIVGIKSLQNSIVSYLTDGIRIALNLDNKIDITNDLISATATLFKQNGNHEITGNSVIDGNLLVKGAMEIDGTVTGNSGTMDINSNITFHSGNTVSGATLSSANGATGTFTHSVIVSNGIVTGGT